MIFNFSWSDYDCYEPHIFEGEEKTSEEFKKDCDKALKESFDEFMSNTDNRWASLSLWMKYALVKMEDYGYKKVKPMEFGHWGLEIPKNDRYSPENNEIDNKEYQEQFPEFLDEIKKMIIHNDAFDAVTYKWIYDRIDKENKNEK
jgi:hypothetical protein